MSSAFTRMTIHEASDMPSSSRATAGDEVALGPDIGKAELRFHENS